MVHGESFLASAAGAWEQPPNVWRVDEQWPDLLDWAFDEMAGEPVQDWDLLVAASPLAESCLHLAADPDCPKARFFLGVLYLIVGDAVRTGYQAHTRREVEDLLAAGGRYPVLRAWVGRSRQLMEQPDSFDYDDWCAGRGDWPEG